MKYQLRYKKTAMSLFDYKKNNVLEVKVSNFGVKIYFGRDDYEWVGKDRIYCRSDLGIVTEGAISDTKHYSIRADQMAVAEELLASLEPAPDLPPVTPTSDLFFLRFSEEPEEDKERGYSFDFTGMQPEDFCYDADGCETEEPDYSQLTDDSDMIEILDDGTVAVKFEGLCGHILEAKTLEDAIQEVQEEGEWSGAAWSDLPKTIWVGEETEDYVPEGTAFQGELIWKEDVKPIPPPTATPTPTPPTPTPSIRSKVMRFAWTLRKQGISWGIAQSMAWAAEAKKAEAIAAAVTFSETLSWDVKKKIRFGAMAITHGRDFARKSLKKNLAADYLAGRSNIMPRPKARPLFV